MRIVHDASRCATSGMCEAVAPEVFEVREDGVLLVEDSQYPEQLRDVVEQAVAACPTGALSIEG